MDVVAIIISKTILFAIPLILGALAGMFSERSGVINVALEGIMVFGSLFASIFLIGSFGQTTFAQNNPQMFVLIALVIAGVSGLIFSLTLAYAAINLKANQIISGTALNMFAPAFAFLFAKAALNINTGSIPLPKDVLKLSSESFGIDSSQIAGWVDILFFKNLYLSTILAFVILIIAFVLLYKTRFGLRLRACGEHPQAADSVGIKVLRMRYIGVAISGFLAGIAGFSFSIANGAAHEVDVLGYGFLAFSVMIFDIWKPFKILFAALFFSFFKSLAVLADTLPQFPDFGLNESQYLYKILPYIITLAALAFTSKNSRAPKAEGIPYDPGKR